MAPATTTTPAQDAERAVRSLVTRVESDVIARSRAIMLFAGVPFLLITGLATALTGHLTWPFAVWALGFTLVVIASVVPRLPHRGRTMGLTGGLAVAALGALMLFGPNVGTGLLYAIVALAGAFFFGGRGVIVTVTIAVVSLTAAALATDRGWLTPEAAPPSLAAWGRMIVSCTISLVVCAVLFLMVQRSLHRSVAAELAANTAERRAAAQREHLIRSTQHAHRLESLGRLAGGVAHDFNNALMVIQSGIELLRDDGDPADRAEILEEVTKGVARASATARQLLTVARRRPRAEEGATAHPAEVIATLASTLRRFLPENITVRTAAKPSPAVAIPTTDLEQAMLNLALNARDAMAVGGELTLGCHEAASGEVVLEVVDQGVGMTAEVQAHIFEPFFTTKGELGTGLGLAMVWGLVQQHGGRVEVDSVLGRGTRIALVVPPAAHRTAAGPATLRPEAPARSLRPRILVVEDEANVRKMIVRILQRDAEVTAVESVADAVAAIARARFALLVTDGVLVDGTAVSVIKAFRAAQAGPVLVCSGYLPEAIDRSLADHEHHFLAKPFVPAQFRSTVDTLLAADG